MLNRFFLDHIFKIILITFILFDGCRTVSPPVIQKTQKPSKGPVAADSQAAADKAFEEMEHPNEPVAPTPNASNEPVHEKNKKEKNTAEALEPKVVTGSRLDWVDGTSKAYPATRYLTGIGEGTDRGQAEDDARAEIAKVFESHINTNTKVQQEYLKVVSQGRNREESRVNVQDMVQVSSQKVLSGIQIAEVYKQTHPKELFYALAVFDRQQAMPMLTDKIKTLDQEIKILMDESSKETKNLQKIKILTSALQKQLLRQTHEAELAVVNPSGKGLPAPIGFEEINRSLTDILTKKFRIYVAVSGDRAGEVKKSLSEGLTREGFVLTNDGKHASVAVKGQVTIKPLDHGDKKWKYVRWQTAFDLVNQSDQTVFGTLNNSGREGHLSTEQAILRSVMKIKKELLPQVSKDVRGYIFGRALNPKK
jgi:hypothetical protein